MDKVDEKNIDDGNSSDKSVAIDAEAEIITENSEEIKKGEMD